MSETVSYKGRIAIVAKGESACEKYAKDHYPNHELESYYSDFVEKLTDDKGFVKIDDSLYKILEKKELSGDDIFEMSPVPNSLEYEFIVQYYNGGCSFQDAMEQAHKDMKKSNA